MYLPRCHVRYLSKTHIVYVGFLGNCVAMDFQADSVEVSCVPGLWIRSSRQKLAIWLGGRSMESRFAVDINPLTQQISVCVGETLAMYGVGGAKGPSARFKMAMDCMRVLVFSLLRHACP